MSRRGRPSAGQPERRPLLSASPLPPPPVSRIRTLLSPVSSRLPLGRSGCMRLADGAAAPSSPSPKDRPGGTRCARVVEARFHGCRRGRRAEWSTGGGTRRWGGGASATERTRSRTWPNGSGVGEHPHGDRHRWVTPASENSIRRTGVASVHLPFTSSSGASSPAGGLSC